MGLAAHNLSGTKARLLESAKDSLEMALSTLPLPYVTTTTGEYEQAENSPSTFTFPIHLLPHERDEVFDPQTPRNRVEGTPASDADGTVYSTRSYSLSTCSTPEVETEQASPEQHVKTSPEQHVKTSPKLHSLELSPTNSDNLINPRTGMSTHTDRLTQSLSCTHTLADDLVPSPLFSRCRKTASIAQVDNVSTPPRPLPPLPFNHTANFQIHGTRIVQLPPPIPMRKTAVQTLIARFEGSLPLPPSPALSSSTASPLPVTPRFQMIKDAFSPDPTNDHLNSYISSANLSRYNTSLADFRSQVRKGIKYLDEQIAQVQNVQAAHTASKSLCKTRLASFWSLEHAATVPGVVQQLDDPKLATRKARIEQLREEGWNIRKERYGFKSDQYYDNFRRAAERELDAYTRRDNWLTS